MSTWTAFYVNTDNEKLVTEQLQTLTGISNVEIGKFPDDLFNNYLLDESAKPTYLAICKTQNNWVAVSHNSFNHLEEWSRIISKNLNTKVIATIAQNTADVYYFSLFDNGEKIREIEVCYSADFEPVNFGKKFDFENEQPGTKQEYDGETEYYFDIDSMDEYCGHFGLTMQHEFAEGIWTTLKVT